MRNKFTITEGESQRILGLHKKAINENLNIFSTNKTVLLEEINYSQKYEQKIERIETPVKNDESQINVFYLYEKTKWKETKDGAKTDSKNSTATALSIFFKCVGYNNFDFLVDENENGKYVWFKSEKLGSVLRGKFCNNNGTSEYKPKVIGNIYTFDFDAVMKAIDDTGKCPKDKSDDLKQDPIKDDVKSGLNNVVDPVGDKVKSDLNNVVNPVNTTISDELYYKIIAP